ncbi:unnamed protein product [Musa acuminata subsp. malaccensis]|uniref:(wild Malaysian banana) hypothetical protein n=1 Tax=Musa acuminata subsp. malaccensis TaxID=214687 RepID=A0A804KFZ3_MUSAM|nr:unnamed protein product [Musa acuminata subsp. malaccensis]
MVNPSCKGFKYSSKRPTWTHKTAGWEVWFQYVKAVVLRIKAGRRALKAFQSIGKR